MPEPFLRLDRSQRQDILADLASQLGREARVLEKDVWVCWALGELFAMPDRLAMVFKGGTSLSKVFNAIHRFSEDIDITVDYLGLDPRAEPFASGASKSRLAALTEVLEAKLAKHLQEQVVPHLASRLTSATHEPGASVVLEAAEKVRVHYPSALEPAGGYIAESVLLEFGGHNAILPQELHTVIPDIAAQLPTLEFPTARPLVLAPARTFWEKATLIHAECHAPRLEVPRLSRHWYDLCLLAGSAIGQEALQRRDLLEDVVKHKMVFYRSAKAKYELCTRGQLVLVPTAGHRDALRKDCEAMKAAGMFYREPPSFEQILERLGALERDVNAAPGAAPAEQKRV